MKKMYNNAIGYWNGKKEKIKQKYPLITDEDLNFHEGKEVEMIEMLGYKLGKTIEEMRRIMPHCKIFYCTLKTIIA